MNDWGRYVEMVEKGSPPFLDHVMVYAAVNGSEAFGSFGLDL